MSFKKRIEEEFNDVSLNINGEKFVPLELLVEALYNIALDEAVIGTLAYKFGNIELKQDDIIKYMNEYTNNVEINMREDKFIAKRI